MRRPRRVEGDEARVERRQTTRCARPRLRVPRRPRVAAGMLELVDHRPVIKAGAADEPREMPVLIDVVDRGRRASVVESRAENSSSGSTTSRRCQRLAGALGAASAWRCRRRDRDRPPSRRPRRARRHRVAARAPTASAVFPIAVGPTIARRAVIASLRHGGPERLTWSLTPHSPAEELTRPGGGNRLSPTPAPPESARFAPSPPRAAAGSVHGRDLPLNRTMLSNHGLPYVGRFACGWHRLSTTDPLRADPL